MSKAHKYTGEAVLKYIVFVIILAVFCGFSCVTSDITDSTEESTMPSSIIFNDDWTATIIGRVQTYRNGPGVEVRIEDENGTKYIVYPHDIGEDLRELRNRLIKFTVIVLDKPRGYGSLVLRDSQTVTPINWEIIQGPPPPKTTSHGVIQVTGILRVNLGVGVFIYVRRNNERWLITPWSNDFFNLNGSTITVEGEGIITEPDGLSENERNSLDEIYRRRELRDVRIIEVHE